MTKTQIEIIKIIKKVLKHSGVNPKSCRQMDFVPSVKSANFRIPWKMLDEYRIGKNDEFNFIELFALISEDKSILKPYPKFEVTKARQSARQVIPVSKSMSKKDSCDISINTSKKLSSIPDSKKKQFIDPVYLVEAIDCSNETHVVGISRSFKNAWEKLVYKAIHDNGRMAKADAEYEVEVNGVVSFKSVVSNYLTCVITKMEFE